MDGNVEDIDTKKYCLWCLLQLATKTKYDTDVPNRLLEQKSFIKWVLTTHSFKHSNQSLGDRGKIDEIKTCLNFFDLKI